MLHSTYLILHDECFFKVYLSVAVPAEIFVGC